MNQVIAPSWPSAKAPGIATIIPAHVARALLGACRAADEDVTQAGAVSVESVEKIRAALALLRDQ